MSSLTHRCMTDLLLKLHGDGIAHPYKKHRLRLACPSSPALLEGFTQVALSKSSHGSHMWTPRSAEQQSHNYRKLSGQAFLELHVPSSGRCCHSLLVPALVVLDTFVKRAAAARPPLRPNPELAVAEVSRVLRLGCRWHRVPDSPDPQRNEPNRGFVAAGRAGLVASSC